MTPRDDVILSYSNIAEGTTLSGQGCPSCKGGASGEHAMSVGRAGAFLWWQCHRASCGFRGKHSVNGDGATTTDERRGRYQPQYKTTELTPHLIQMFAERNHLEEGTIDAAQWSYTPDYAGRGARVVMPIFNPQGRVRGHSFRSYDGTLPKALINAALAEETIGWYRFKKYGKILVIVEDPVSALRCTQGGVDAVSLYGTTLNDARIAEIREQQYNKVVLCLDGDVFALAMRYVTQFRRWLPQLTIKLLDDIDIKDMSPAQFDLFITEILQ